jgi:acetyltransferase (GNAT) family protein
MGASRREAAARFAFAGGRLSVIEIRPAAAADRVGIWDVLAPVIGAGDTYALPRDMGEADALAYWLAASHEAFVAAFDGRIAGTYYMRANQQGGGAHVANCGYVTSPRFAKRGIAAAMCSSTSSLPRTSTRSGFGGGSGSARWAPCRAPSIIRIWDSSMPW